MVYFVSLPDCVSGNSSFILQTLDWMPVHHRLTFMNFNKSSQSVKLAYIHWLDSISNHNF